jgi:hypothetical protein
MAAVQFQTALKVKRKHILRKTKTEENEKKG